MNAREMLVFLSAFTISQALNLRYPNSIQWMFAFLGAMTLIYVYFTGGIKQ